MLLRTGRLAALAFPDLNKGSCTFLASHSFLLLNAGSTEHYRVGCDVMNLFFVFDEHTDVAPGDTARMLADVSMDAMRNPHKPRPVTESVVGEITRQCVSS